MAKILLTLLIAFGLTVIIEGVIVFLIFRKSRYVFYSFLMNLLTNPVATLISALVPVIFPLPYAAVLAVVEIVVVIVEAMLIHSLMKLSPIRSALLSLLLNAVSLGVGLLLLNGTLVW